MAHSKVKNDDAAQSGSSAICYGANSPLAGAVECVTLVVVDDEPCAVLRLKTVGIRRLSFIQ